MLFIFSWNGGLYTLTVIVQSSSALFPKNISRSSHTKCCFLPDALSKSDAQVEAEAELELLMMQEEMSDLVEKALLVKRCRGMMLHHTTIPMAHQTMLML